MRFIRISTLVCLTMLLFVQTPLASSQCTETYGSGLNRFSLATGSPGELGLLKVLAEAFSRDYDTTLCWQKAGSGESLKLLKEKKVDMIMVHAPAAEKQAVQEGWATARRLIGSNEFYIVGPKTDPAGIAKATSVADAYAKIAAAQSKFYSRGDNSGTHKKEMDIWQKAGVQPDGEWYLVTKSFMMVTLKTANDNGGYFMTDSSTWVAAQKEMPNLAILFQGDQFLINTYNTLCQPEGATPGQPFASKFIEFVASEAGQKIIREFGADQYGEGLYNDAAYARQYDR